ncbi:MAG: GNAT family N-acetyltransferase [Chloroflexi bacterium]|nr:GNAT family N-acetyltransferase [Chloroflexota bacterium]
MRFTLFFPASKRKEQNVIAMIKDFNTPKVVCRPALPLDSTDVFEFTKFIWEGHDYIQYVWNEWFADPHGLLAVAEYGGRAVGMAKVTLVSKGQWWLEGFRVDPNVQGLKIGSRIHEYVNGWWDEYGDGMVRLMTSSERVQVHHLSERTGYHKVGEVNSFSAPALDEKTDSFSTVRPDELNAALDFAITSEPYQLNHNLIDIGWTQMALDEISMKQLIAEEKVFWWHGRGGLFIKWDDNDDDGNKVLGVSLPACKIESVPELLTNIRRFASANGYVSVFGIFYVDPQIVSALTKAGYSLPWDSTAYIFERRHPARP